ncbi:receptor-like protein kinase FERONIA [Senna tora]|uniref:Receptor-like protein kinase FERONIA n=1 Tax=Senna tora TaxID=362788 RepID=A0A834TJF5_9FABA|nr:receptor-like protein kinase FERONIA [Senna tora]
MVILGINRNRRSASNPATILLYCLYFLVLQHHLSLVICVYLYQPIEDYVIFCGTLNPPSNTPDGQNRTWIADTIQSPLFSLIESPKHSPSQTATTSRLRSSASQYLYTSARVSHTEFTYSFAVTDGPKFVRLHFYPSSYLNFQRFDSLFSVKSGNFTLLKDFNASLVADYTQDHEIVSKEYCIHVDPGQRLNVTFTPTNSNNNNYAFINSIEIVSMPTYLYFTDPTQPGLPLVGRDFNDFQIDNTRAMEMEYRINVGVKAIGPEGDTGMFRSWEIDVDFLEKVRPASLPYDVREQLNYGNFRIILRRRMFILPVAPTGRARLKDVRSAGDRVFQIFLAESMAEVSADVILWSGGRMVPYYKDYIVRFQNGSLDRTINLSIKLQPHPNPNRRAYDDVILNGIEIFKLSDESNGNLAQLNPPPPVSPPPPSATESTSKTALIAIVVAVASGFIVLFVLGFIIFRRRLIRSPPKVKYGHSTTSKSLPSDLCRCFSIAEIKAATNNFDDLLKIGVGGFGNVYKGYIDDNTVPVAIKRLKPGSQQGAHEFLTEIEMLSQLRHLHLVSLIGYCNDGNEMILVYEFMARGTLRDHLYDSDNQPLSWKQRLETCLGAARGLHYLHTGAKHNIIHRDVKATNILIDEKWVAKVSDFGLSKVGPTGMSRSHISTVVKGSIGYLDPEYYKRQRLTQKSDVYSFGVVLLEVLCGRPPLLRTTTREKRKGSLVEWVRRSHREGLIHETIDPLVIESITPECLKAFGEMALKCLADNGDERPSMSDVVWGLEFALELQERSEEETLLGGALCENTALLKKESKEEEEEEDDDEESKMGFTSSEVTVSESKSSKMTISSSEDQALVSGLVFSELRDPTAR